MSDIAAIRVTTVYIGANADLVRGLPYRTATQTTNALSDLTNLAFIGSEEIERVVEFIGEQEYRTKSIESFEKSTGSSIPGFDPASDPLYKEAVELVVRHKQGSVSLLQRRLGIGYQRAARLIDQLENSGIVGPYDGSKAREVLVGESYLESEEFRK